MAAYRPRKSLHYWDTLTNIRCEAGVTRAKLAASVDVDRSTIWRIETGEIRPSQVILNAYGALARRRASES